MNHGLILVDIQNDYFPGGAMELEGSEAAAEHAVSALAAFRADGAPVFHVQHLAAQPGATFFLPGTLGAAIHPAVAPQDGEPVVQKHYPNSFRDTALLHLLRDREVTELTICGAMTHMCIDATVRAAFDLEFACTVLADACATRDLAFGGVKVPAARVHAAFMAALASPYANVVFGADG